MHGKVYTVRVLYKFYAEHIRHVLYGRWNSSRVYPGKYTFPGIHVHCAYITKGDEKRYVAW